MSDASTKALIYSLAGVGITAMMGYAGSQLQAESAKKELELERLKLEEKMVAKVMDDKMNPVDRVSYLEYLCTTMFEGNEAKIAWANEKSKRIQEQLERDLKEKKKGKAAAEADVGASDYRDIITVQESRVSIENEKQKQLVGTQTADTCSYSFEIFKPFSENRHSEQLFATKDDMTALWKSIEGACVKARGDKLVWGIWYDKKNDSSLDGKFEDEKGIKYVTCRCIP